MSIIIKNSNGTTKIETTEDEANVTVSSRNKLYDATEALAEETPIIIKASEIVKEEPAPEVKEEPKVLYTTTSTEPIFSWQKTDTEPSVTVENEPDLSNATIEQLLADAEERANEFVIVTEEKKEPGMFDKVAKFFSNTLNIIIVLIFLAALFIGGKTAFDYIQEAESVKAIASKLEAENKSDIPEPVAKALADFGSDDKATDSSTLKSSGFVKIIRTKAYYLLGQRKDGKIELRTGGSVGWRTNNPAEIAYGDFAKKTGAIAQYSKYAIYPSLEKGVLALETYLFGTNLYRNLTIQDAMKKFYGSDAKQAEATAKAISIALNISRYRTKLSSLNNSQKVKMIDVIKKKELELEGITRIYNDMDDFNKRGF